MLGKCFSPSKTSKIGVFRPRRHSQPNQFVQTFGAECFNCNKNIAARAAEILMLVEKNRIPKLFCVPPLRKLCR